MTDWKDFTLVVEVIDGVVNDVYVPNCDIKISWTVEEHETGDLLEYMYRNTEGKRIMKYSSKGDKNGI